MISPGMTSLKQDFRGKHKSHCEMCSEGAIVGVHEHINSFLVISYITLGHRIHIKPSSISNLMCHGYTVPITYIGVTKMENYLQVLRNMAEYFVSDIILGLSYFSLIRAGYVTS